MRWLMLLVVLTYLVYLPTVHTEPVQYSSAPMVTPVMTPTPGAPPVQVGVQDGQE